MPNKVEPSYIRGFEFVVIRIFFAGIIGVGICVAVAMYKSEKYYASPEYKEAELRSRKSNTNKLDQAHGYCSNRGGTKNVFIRYKTYDLTVACNDGTAVSFRLQ